MRLCLNQAQSRLFATATRVDAGSAAMNLFPTRALVIDRRPVAKIHARRLIERITGANTVKPMQKQKRNIDQSDQLAIGGSIDLGILNMSGEIG